MLRIFQRTLRRTIETTGIGLHSGEKVHLVLKPAPEGSGVVFVRSDLEGGVELPARADLVVDTALATSIGVEHPVHGEVRVGTVEHLLSAIYGLGIDNLRVEVDGPEIPIMDGSAAPFVFLLQSAGVRVQSRYKRFLKVLRPVEVSEGDKRARLEPSAGFQVRCAIDFDHPLIGTQTFSFDFSDREYYREICRARTFGFLREVELMKSMGLARGGSLDNAIVVDEFSIMNPDGLRFADEFVRHKVLDTLGDLALLGAPVLGTLSSMRSGHALNNKLARAVLADPSCYELVEITPPATEAEVEGLRVPALGLA